GWRASPGPEGAQTVLVETPTGHRYRSRAPQSPGVEAVESQAQLQPEHGQNGSRVELVFRRLVMAA
ncbi:MAG: hypothetical protein WCF12_12610, partial [Propionicimonas sp.]